jgi:hypothetical protein
MSKDSHFRFDHPSDIRIGTGRIVYAYEQVFRGTTLPEGWVLPGGGRTQVREHAESAARYINDVASRARY